ncbi:probable serine/threonine-protein kinase DDB_G0267514 [Homarus americanus]|nr:probable serine/threonine-protein kinase DDB_G0267514 [Homarus americanus]
MSSVRRIYDDDVAFLVNQNINELGSGTSGTAFLVPWHGKEAVLKLARKDTSKTLNDFWEETKMMIHSNGAGGTPKVIRFCDCPPAILQSYKGRLSLDDILLDHELLMQYDLTDLAIRIGEKLYEFNQTGAVHNDLKPDNILVSGPPSNPYVSIIDLGLSCYANENIACTAEHDKYPWMAPEVCMGLDSTSISDTYSYGYVLSEMVKEAPGDHSEISDIAYQAMEPKPRHRMSL